MKDMDTPGQIDKKVILLVTTLPSFFVPFMGSSINIALPSIGKEFAMDAVLLSWVPTAYLLAVAMFQVPFGRIADIYGRKRVFLWGLYIYTLSCILIALSRSAAVLIFFRACQGFGASMIFGTAVAILSSSFPPRERGKVLGINVAAVYAGLSMGPVLGGVLTQHFGWRSIFWFNVPLAIAILVVVLIKLKMEWAEARGERFDYPGATIYSVALLVTIYGLSLLPTTRGISLLLGGLFGLFIFLRHQMRVESPVFSIHLFIRNKVFAFSSLAALINYCATFAVGFLLSLFLQFTKGFSPEKAGLVLVAQPVMQAIFSPFAGKLSDRIEPRVVASIGMGFTAFGLSVLTFLHERSTLPFIVAVLALLGFGFALFSSPNTNAVMSSIEKKSYGVASGTLGTMRATGMMLSMGIVMLIFTATMGRVQIVPEYFPLFLKSVNMAFRIFALLCVGGIFASLARGKVQ
jgi:EmrB/QacA subfamily drug resistance transporter